MTEAAKRASWRVERPAFDLGAVARPAAWGGTAAVAMILAMISAYSGTGLQRPGSAQATTQLPPALPPDVALRAVETAGEVRRLSDAVHALAVDREQLLKRIVALEHGLDDVTGAIKRQAADNPPTPVMTPAATPPRVEVATSAPAVPAAAPPRTDVAIISVPPADPPPAAPVVPAASTRMMEAAAEPAAAAPTPVPGLGIDVGGAVNFEGLRTLWFSTRHNDPDLPDDLYPVVTVRENPKTRSVDLRLVVGPIADAETAARFCAALLASHHYCQTVAFEGQRMSLAPKLALPATHRSTSGP